jgi:hypothetical protein
VFGGKGSTAGEAFYCRTDQLVAALFLYWISRK